MSNRNADKNGKATRFSATNQPKKKGRKPSLYAELKELAKLEGNIDLSRDDFIKLSLLMLSKPISEIKALVMADDTPTWIVCIGRAILKDAAEGRISTLDSLLDRIFGKATQPTQQSVAVEMKGSIPISEWVKDRIKKK